MSNILTGLRANGDLHLGNYFGAIKPMIELQKKLTETDQLFMFVPDLHSFTTPIDHSQLYKNVLENVKIYLAAGLQTNQTNIFIYRQSRISAHSELCWILSCFSYFGQMQKMTQFKEKKQKLQQEKNSVTVGLFSYPILMASDILLYQAEWIPLGEDQQQHLELTRDLALRMNKKFGKLFTVPKSWEEQLQFVQKNEGLRVRSLSNPLVKMSKSVSDPKGTILLKDDPKQAAKKIMSAATDSLSEINYDWQRQPGITNLLQLLAEFQNKNIEQIKKEWVGQTSYADLKKVLAEEVEKFLSTLQKKLTDIKYSDLEELLQAKEQTVSLIAKGTLTKVQKAIGLLE